MKAVIRKGKVDFVEESEQDILQKENDKIIHDLLIEPNWLTNRKKEYKTKIDPFILSAISDSFLSNDDSMLNELKAIKKNIKLSYPKI